VAACGNTAFADRLLIAVEKIYPAPTPTPREGGSRPSALIEESQMRLLQLKLRNEIGGRACCPAISEAFGLNPQGAESGGGGGGEVQDDSGLQKFPDVAAAARVELTAALHPPSAFPDFAGGSALDARLWWAYAEYMHTSTRKDRQSTGASGTSDMTPLQAQGYAEALWACCRALALASGSSYRPEDILPITLTLLR